MKSVLAITLVIGASVAADSYQHEQHVHGVVPAHSETATSALSAEAVQQLLNGEGMGLAKPAELHGYAGPKHVLELKADLAITPEQEQQVEAIRQRMLNKAKPLGRQIVDAERALDEAFKQGHLTESQLAGRVATIAKLQGDLRQAHLQAHLETKPILTDTQTRKYYELRNKHH
jgi:Spy/CpxP family protein refolding chaperone